MSNDVEEDHDQGVGGLPANAGICAASTAAGNRCYFPALPGDDYCFSHSPRYAEERKEIATRGGRTGGRGRPARTVEYHQIKQLLAGLIRRVDAGDMDPKRASTQGYLIDVLLRALKQEEDAEAEEIRERIEALEELQGVRKWLT
jgi:hypothetical protein